MQPDSAGIPVPTIQPCQIALKPCQIALKSPTRPMLSSRPRRRQRRRRLHVMVLLHLPRVSDQSAHSVDCSCK